MEHVESLLKVALAEIERLLSTRTVVGEPITVEGNTIIPLVAVGFGFGAGGGSGKEQKKTSMEGLGGGTGGGGGIKPVAVIIVNKDGYVSRAFVEVRRLWSKRSVRPSARSWTSAARKPARG